MNQFGTFAAGASARPARGGARVARSRAKRAFDVSIALSAVVLLIPLFAVCALAIWAEDRRPVLFRQRRTGLDGHTFRIYKFRTMRVVEDGAQILQATRRDRRVTRIGAVLRTLSLDELPQLFNVIRGDMSLVGPRPHALAHDEAWAKIEPRYTARFRARPGLTGYAQVQGYRGEIRDREDVVRRIEADVFYIDNWSLRLELAILLRTIPLLFTDRNAY